MSEKRYQIFYTGKLHPGQARDTVKSNLVLFLGISEAKAERLLTDEPKVLKRCDSAVEAQTLLERFDGAGIDCVVRDTGGGQNPGDESGSESSLVRLLKTFSTDEGNDSPSLLRRLVKGGQKRKRA
ncbi:MAG: hypothetical protein ACQETD_04900 [Pseudomonadota bacterium]